MIDANQRRLTRTAAKSRVTVVLAILFLYGLAYPGVSSPMGDSAYILSMVPVVLAAWLLDVRAGVLTAIAAMALNSALVTLVSGRPWIEWMTEGGGLGFGALLGVGVGVGLLRHWKSAHDQFISRMSRQAGERDVFDEIRRITTFPSNIDEVYRPLIHRIRGLIPLDHLSIAVYDADTQSWTYSFVWGQTIPECVSGRASAFENSAADTLAGSENGFVCELDERRMSTIDHDAQRLFAAAGLRSGMAVPLRSDDRVIGLMLLRSTVSDAYSAADLEIAERIGDQIAGSIVSSRLLDERQRAVDALRESADKYRRLYDNTPVMMHSIDPQAYKRQQLLAQDDGLRTR